MNYHYLDTQNREIGPVPMDALRALRTAGSLTDNTLARPETGGPWTPLAGLLGPAPISAPPTGTPAPAVEAASAALADARAALKHLVSNPALGLPEAWKELGPKRALAAGLAMIAVTILFIGGLIQLSDSFALIRPHDAGNWFKLLLGSGGAAALYVGTLFAARRATGGTAGVECDVFVIGAASMTGWVLGLAYALFGLRNYEVLLYLAIGVAGLVIVQLFIGLTRLGGMSERHASLALPLVLIVNAWGNKLIFSAL
jgi:hypothetical protein